MTPIPIRLASIKKRKQQANRKCVLNTVGVHALLNLGGLIVITTLPSHPAQE